MYYLPVAAMKVSEEDKKMEHQYGVYVVKHK